MIWTQVTIVICALLTVFVCTVFVEYNFDRGGKAHHESKLGYVDIAAAVAIILYIMDGGFTVVYTLCLALVNFLLIRAKDHLSRRTTRVEESESELEAT